MKAAVHFLLLFLFLTAVCLGQQTAASVPASKEDVEKLFEAMHIHEMMKPAMDASLKQGRQLAHEQMKRDFPNLRPDQAAQVDKMMDDLFDNLPIGELLQNIVPVYQKHFTKGDIDAMLAFYSSSVGQKFIKETPAITQETMQASYGLIQQYMQTGMRKLRQRAEQMQKDANTKATPPSSPKPN